MGSAWTSPTASWAVGASVSAMAVPHASASLASMVAHACQPASMSSNACARMDSKVREWQVQGMDRMAQDRASLCLPPQETSVSMKRTPASSLHPVYTGAPAMAPVASVPLASQAHDASKVSTWASHPLPLGAWSLTTPSGAAPIHWPYLPPRPSARHSGDRLASGRQWRQWYVLVLSVREAAGLWTLNQPVPSTLKPCGLS